MMIAEYMNYFVTFVVMPATFGYVVSNLREKADKYDLDNLARAHNRLYETYYSDSIEVLSADKYPTIRGKVNALVDHLGVDFVYKKEGFEVKKLKKKGKKK